MIPLQKNQKYKQGVFVPKNKGKFKGSQAIYRSSLELKFMRFCDRNPNVLFWTSESIIIPYINPFDYKTHRYHVDNFIVIKEGNDIKKYLIEIKPYKQTHEPSQKYKKKKYLIYEQHQWIINNTKWEAAKQYCKKKGWEFKIITEKNLL